MSLGIGSTAAEFPSSLEAHTDRNYVANRIEPWWPGSDTGRKREEQAKQCGGKSEHQEFANSAKNGRKIHKLRGLRQGGRPGAPIAEDSGQPIDRSRVDP